MFDKKKSPPQKRIDSLIGAGTTVHGDVTFSGGLRIDGAVHGKVSTVDNESATLVVSEHARVDGEVRVSHVVINGSVSGPVTANDYLELRPRRGSTVMWSIERWRCTSARSSRASWSIRSRSRRRWWS